MRFSNLPLLQTRNRLFAVGIIDIRRRHGIYLMSTETTLLKRNRRKQALLHVQAVIHAGATTPHHERRCFSAVIHLVSFAPACQLTAGHLPRSDLFHFRLKFPTLEQR